jgi:transposase
VIFEHVDTELKQRMDDLIKDLGGRITLLIASDEGLSETADVIRSIAEIGPVASSMLLAEMPESGTTSDTGAAALNGLAR